MSLLKLSIRNSICYLRSATSTLICYQPAIGQFPIKPTGYEYGPMALVLNSMTNLTSCQILFLNNVLNSDPIDDSHTRMDGSILGSASEFVISIPHLFLVIKCWPSWLLHDILPSSEMRKIQRVRVTEYVQNNLVVLERHVSTLQQTKKKTYNSLSGRSFRKLYRNLIS